jgi:hypothetical protein
MVEHCARSRSRTAPLRGAPVIGLQGAAPQHLGQRRCRVDGAGEGLRAGGAQKIVRILALGEQCDAQGLAWSEQRQRQVDDAVGGGDSGLVAVEAENGLGRDFPQERELGLWSGSASGATVPGSRRGSWRHVR